MRRAAYVSLGTLAARFLTALSGLIIARAVGPASFGVYAAVWALVELSTSMTEIGLITGLKREGGHHPERIPFLLGNTLVVRSAAGMALLLGAALLRGVLVRNPDAARIFVPLGLTALSIIGAESLFAVLQVEARQRAVATLVAGRAFIFFLGVIALAWSKADIVAFAWCQGGVYVGTALITAVYVRITMPISLRLTHVPRQVHGAMAFAISEILYSVYLSLPLLCLSRLGTEEAVGWFAVAQRFVTLGVAIGIAATHEAFLPALFRLYGTAMDEFRRVAAASHRILTGIGFLGAALLFALAEPLIVFLQGEEYRPSVSALRMLCWYALLTYATLTADTVLTTADRMRPKIITQIIAVAGVLIVAVLFIPRYDIGGACATALAGAAITLVLQLAVAARFNLLPWKRFGRVVLYGVVTCVAAAGVVLFQSWPVGILFACVATVCWGIYIKGEMTRYAET